MDYCVLSCLKLMKNRIYINMFLKLLYFPQRNRCGFLSIISRRIPEQTLENKVWFLILASSIITNAKQIGGTLVSDKVNITSTQCYYHCTQLPRCAAADYNFGTKECWIHSSTHCASHVPTKDKCCDHFKRGLICSVRP